MKVLLAALLFASPVSAGTHYQDSSGVWWKHGTRRPRSERVFVSSTPDRSSAGFSTDRTCIRQEYREEYIPGTAQQPGHIRSWNETVEVPCRDGGGYTRRETIEYDTNDCTDGKIAGGLLGGAAGAALSRGDGRWWAIPLGVVTGATIGCDIDGG